MFNSFYKLIILMLAILTVNASAFALELPISTELGLKGQLGVKLSHPENETFGKGLPLGPSSARFFDGSLWVSDTLNARIVQFDSNGSYIGEIALNSTPKANPGDFYLARDKNGSLNIWVCDEDNCSVSIFDDLGVRLKTLGSLEKDDFVCPCQIEQTSNGNMLVFDWAKHEIIELNNELKVMGRTPAAARTMLVDGNWLLYLSLTNTQTILNKRNLKTGAVSTSAIAIDSGADPEPDILACDDKGAVILGLRETAADELPRYMLKKVPTAEASMQAIAVAYPPAFAVRPVITDNQGNYYNYYLDTEPKQPVLKLNPIKLNFSLKGSKG